MYALVDIQGAQFRVEKDQKLVVPKLEAEVGAKVSFDRVLMIGGDSVAFGQPTVSGSKVDATVLSHGRSDKIIVFKKKRRKGYKKRNTHRQGFTEIQINSIKKK